jgi:glycosyltransferase involved in cell wall biosynthesis
MPQQRCRSVKVVYLNPIGSIGGGEQVLLACLSGVQQARPEAELHLVVGTEGPLLERAREFGIRVTLLPMPAALSGMGDSAFRYGRRLRGAWDLFSQAFRAVPPAWRYLRAMRSLLRQLRPTLIHSNGLKTHWIARLSGPRATPVVWHLHDFYSLRPLMARTLNRARRGVAGGIAVSEAVACDARKVLPGLPVAVIPNAVDLTSFSPQAEDGRWLDEAAGWAPAGCHGQLAARGTRVVRVGLVATYARWKGHDVFLEAAARALAGSPRLPLRFYIVGGPIYHTRAQFTVAELKARAAALGIADRVGFVGFQQDIARVYRSLDLVVHASIHPEPFGLTIAEAMACGKPVIVSRAGGAAELFADGHDAVGVALGDVDGLAAAVRRLAADPDLRRRLGDAARKTATQRFDRGRFGPQVLDAYHQFLHGRLVSTRPPPARSSPC